jgi:protein subunit release factor B
MNLIGISEAEHERLRLRLTALNIRADEIEETFTRSGGPGGQNVNKTATAVVLVHHPTGLQVRCETERSQAQNRFRARWLLLDKIEQHRRQAFAAERARLEKLRRQSRPRPRRVKARMLEDKARQAAKKRRRQRRFEE